MAPEEVNAGVVVHDGTPDVPPTVHNPAALVPVGGTPVTPVTAALTVKVELIVPGPLEVSTTVGVTLAIVTFPAAVAAREV